jgi:hypothetical protein
MSSLPPLRETRPADTRLDHATALKAELKAWEAAFRLSHGDRKPTAIEIEATPAIGLSCR